MAKIKLTELAKEAIKEIERKEKVRIGTNYYLRKMDAGIEKLKALMRRDGYNV